MLRRTESVCPQNSTLELSTVQGVRESAQDPLPIPPLNERNIVSLLAVLLLLVAAERNVCQASQPLVDKELLQFQIADGRIRCIVTSRQDIRVEGSSATFPHQRLTVDAGPAPVVRLACEKRDGTRLTVTFGDGRIEFQCEDEQAAWQVVQGKSGRYVVRHGDRETSYPSFWHGMLELQGTSVGNDVVALLEVLRPHWSLESQMSCVRKTLVSSDKDPISRDQVMRWVEELSSRDFQVRQSADHALRQFGHQVAPVLKHIQPERLNAEQRRRIRQIVRSLDTDREDQPTMVAHRMCGDIWVWCKFLESNQATTRQLAEKRLSVILSKPITFDTDAGPQGRASQVAQLQRDLRLR